MVNLFEFWFLVTTLCSNSVGKLMKKPQGALEYVVDSNR